MASPPVLDVDPLLAPIPGAEPAGSALPLNLREELDQARKEIDPADFDPKDPSRPTEMKRADWPRIVEQTQNYLVNQSKDLMLAARLTEALTVLHGFAGLRDGLTLMRRLVGESWDFLRPVIEEPDDLEARGAAFNWLDDPDRGARFPNVIRRVPLILGEKHKLSVQDWSLVRSGKGGVTAADLENAITSATRDDCVRVSEDLGGVIEELKAILDILNQRMGNLAPGLTRVRQVVFECLTLAQQVLERKPAPVSEAEAPAEEEAAAGDAAGGGGGGGGSKGMTNRAQVYARLSEAADVLSRLEPHSPIPYVIRRAVALGDLPFHELIKELIKDTNVLQDLSRNLGIKELVE